jgi:diaminopimelate decarboxylase
MEIGKKQISFIVQKALRSKHILGGDDTSAVFYDLFFIGRRIGELKKAFPQNTLHAVAIKANPFLNNLKFVKALNVGVEAASLPEVYIALKAGFPVHKIVFDSPAKTEVEISFALKKGININADSFQELDIIKALLKRNKTKSKIGIRINPQVGTGKIVETSVAGDYSKFGIPIKEYRNELQDYFLNNEWLRGIHLHIGSQGISKNMLIKGAKIVYNFTQQTNTILKKNRKKQIERFDIGGGLPVSYYSDKKSVTLKEYAIGLKKSCPELFAGKFKLITEFGRYIYANSAWAISRVEYVKKSKNLKTAVIHIGADMFIRKAYMPKKWHHEIFVLNKNGDVKTGRKEKYVIAGPLCFAADVLAKGILLPEVSPGDYIIIKDVGAYTLSMWSRYNSRQMPKVIGYKFRGGKFSILKDREKINKVVEFWSRA